MSQQKQEEVEVPLWKLILSYLEEALLAFMVSFLLKRWIGSGIVLKFIKDSGKDWAQLAGVMVAAALVIWGMYVSISDSDFGTYLINRKKDRAYTAAFSFAIFVPATASAALIICAYTDSQTMHEIGLFLLIYLFLNIYTMYKNIINLALFKKIFDDIMK